MIVALYKNVFSLLLFFLLIYHRGKMGQRHEYLEARLKKEAFKIEAENKFGKKRVGWKSCRILSVGLNSLRLTIIQRKKRNKSAKLRALSNISR